MFVKERCGKLSVRPQVIVEGEGDRYSSAALTGLDRAEQALEIDDAVAAAVVAELGAKKAKADRR
jgi:hypothetical protein